MENHVFIGIPYFCSESSEEISYSFWRTGPFLSTMEKLTFICFLKLEVVVKACLPSLTANVIVNSQKTHLNCVTT